MQRGDKYPPVRRKVQLLSIHLYQNIILTGGPIKNKALHMCRAFAIATICVIVQWLQEG